MKRAVPFLIILLLALPTVAYAQDGQSALPSTAVEAVKLLAALLATIWGGGHLGNLFTDMLKRFHWGIMSDGQKKQVGGLLAEVAALLLSVGSAYVVSHFLLPTGEYLDQSGLWPVLLAAWPVAREVYTRRQKQMPY